MDALISYFSDLEKRPLERAGFFIAGMVFLWLIENAVPLLQTHYKRSLLVIVVTFVAYVSRFGKFLSTYIIAWLALGPHTDQSCVCFYVCRVFSLML